MQASTTTTINDKQPLRPRQRMADPGGTAIGSTNNQEHKRTRDTIQKPIFSLYCNGSARLRTEQYTAFKDAGRHTIGSGLMRTPGWAAE
jgi:hypothetical protein